MDEEHPSIANRDWRLQAVTTLAHDVELPWNGKTFKAGTPVEVTGFLKYEKSLIAVQAPNPAAMYMSLAKRAGDAGNQFFSSEFSKSNVVLSDGTTKFTSNQEDRFFNALEDLLACVVFSYTALEAFANEAIPDDFLFVRERADKKCKETYYKAQIERNTNLDTKLTEILPGLFSVPSPKNTKAWSKYRQLNQLRDRFIHLKSSDWKESGPENADDYIWTRLLASRPAQSPNIALALMQYYYAEDKPKPRWIHKLESMIETQKNNQK